MYEHFVCPVIRKEAALHLRPLLQPRGLTSEVTGHDERHPIAVGDGVRVGADLPELELVVDDRRRAVDLPGQLECGGRPGRRELKRGRIWNA